MRFLTPQQMLETGAEAHLKAQDETLSDKERFKLMAKAERLYNDVLEMASTEPFALASIGSLYVERGLWGIGIALLERAVEYNPTDHHALNALGAAYRKTGKAEKAREWLLKALEHAPKDASSARILCNLAGTYVNEGEPEKALEWARKCLEADPNFIDAMLNAGLAYLELGSYQLGWAGLETSRGRHNRKARSYGPDVTYWKGEKDKTVVVFGEQGVGDEIMYAHCLPDLIAQSKEVIIDCHPRLVNIFKQSFPDLRVFGTRKEKGLPEWLQFAKVDHHVAIGSLPYFFRNSASEFPDHNGYIKAAPGLAQHYLPKDAAVRRLRVGLSWIGGTKATHLHLRSLPPETLKPLLTIPGIEWVSLQYTPDAGLIVDEMKKFGADISHDAEMNADLDKLFGCIAGLDLVITVPTSNVHFAGGLGVPAWVIAPKKCSWQFMRDTMDWYPQHTVYRQREHGDWAPVIAGLAADLVALRNSKQRQAAE